MQLLNTQIKNFYDRSTPVWLDVWGEHMHHGHYGPDGKQQKERVAAQLDMIEAMLDWGKVSDANQVLDAGCGVGGSARYLAKKFDANALGFTLSPVQAENANRYNQQAGLSDQVNIEVRDMMTLTEVNQKFDLIWSMESAEHIAEKARLFDLFYQHLQPDGTLLMATWCHRHPDPALTQTEKNLLDKVCQLYHLPPMVSINNLATMATNAGFKNIRTANWSDAVSPFWKTVIRSAFTWRGMTGLLKSGSTTIKGAWAMQYMQRGYQMGLIKFGVLRGER